MTGRTYKVLGHLDPIFVDPNELNIVNKILKEANIALIPTDTQGVLSEYIGDMKNIEWSLKFKILKALNELSLDYENVETPQDIEEPEKNIDYVQDRVKETLGAANTTQKILRVQVIELHTLLKKYEHTKRIPHKEIKQYRSLIEQVGTYLKKYDKEYISQYIKINKSLWREQSLIQGIITKIDAGEDDCGWPRVEALVQAIVLLQDKSK